MSLSERVKYLRERLGWTPAELDEVADLSCGHVCSIERGRREAPSSATLNKLARALKVDVGWLINGGKQPQIAGTK